MVMGQEFCGRCRKWVDGSECVLRRYESIHPGGGAVLAGGVYHVCAKCAACESANAGAVAVGHYNFEVGK